MDTAIGQSDLLQALGWAVFNSLWQMAILWVAFQFVTSMFRIRRSSLKNSLSVFLLLSGFAWFIFTFIAGLSDPNNLGTAYGGVMNMGHNTALNQWLARILPVASIVYLILLLLPFLNLIRNYRYVQIIRRYGLSRADAQWRMFVQKVAAQMGIRKSVHIWMSDLVTSPVTIGYIKPIILLPLAAVNHLTLQQTEAVILHELSHIKRSDYFINLLVKCIQTILYFNPFVKAFARIIEREREKSCDETVIQFQYEPHGYATALLLLEKAAHIPHHSLTVAASDGHKGEFRKRIEWIMGIQKARVFSFNKMAGIMAALLCFIGLNALLIIGKSGNKSLTKNSFSLLSSSPYGFFSGHEDGSAKGVPGNKPENKRQTIANSLPYTESAAKAEPTDDPSTEEQQPLPEPGNSAYHYIYNLQNVIPMLAPEEEKQVQEALQESKKIIQETKWKEVETSIADAMNSAEKQVAKEEFKKSFNKADWNKIGDQLRIAYDNIDWNTVNVQLDNAIASIKIDSLENVYTLALHGLTELQKELVKENQPGVPDTDLTLKTIEVTRKEMLRTIDRLRSARPRKIIKL